MSEKNLAGEKEVTEITETTIVSSTSVDEATPSPQIDESSSPSDSSSKEAIPAEQPIEEIPPPDEVKTPTASSTEDAGENPPSPKVGTTEVDSASASVDSTPTSAGSSTEDSSESATKAKKKKRRRRKKTNDSNDQETILNLKKGQHIKGKIKNITEFGAFVDLGIAQDGLVHISQMARQKVEKPTDVVEEGQEIDVWVKKVDKKRGRISLTMVKPVALRLKDIKPDEELEGVVTRLEPYGAFVDISSERDGLVHISEITHEYINHPQDALTIDQQVKIKVLKVDHKKRQVDLSIKALLPPPPPKEEPKPVVREQYERPKRKSKKPKAEKQEKIEEVPMITTMEAAFSVFQDENSSAGDNRTKEPTRQKQELVAIISRTLATE